MEPLEPHDLLMLARASLAHHLAEAKALESRRCEAWAHHRAQAVIQSKQVRALQAKARQEGAPC